jgi:hypothetical protein
MSYSIYPTPVFKKHFKQLYKKYASLKNDLNELLLILKDNPDYGIPLGHNIFKIRLAISSKGKGKSGGARIITYLINADNELYLVYIYDKSQLENITREQILELLKNAGLTGTN